MEAYRLDLTGPDPTHEAAYARVRRTIAANKAFLDKLTAAKPQELSGNWKVGLIRQNADVVALRALWRKDAEFKAYLRGKLSDTYGKAYTEKLILIFLS